MHKRITNYLKAGYTGLYVLSHEEHRATADIVKACNAANRQCFAWDVVTGYVPLNETAQKIQGGAQDLFAPFKIIHTGDAVVIIRDIQLLLANCTSAEAMGYLRTMINGLYLGLGGGEGENAKPAISYIIVAPSVKLPPELEKDFQVVEFELPDREELGEVVRQIATSAKQTIADIEPLVDACSGLTSKEASDALSLSFVESGTLSPRVVAREKAATLKKNGLLEVIESKIKADDIGGLGELKGWVDHRRPAFTKEAREWGLPMPKGFLMLGLPGCGKSLVAKAVSNILGVPLLKLDAGKLFGSLVGQSEANIRSVIQTAEAISPCVLWIDELEKGFGGSKSSNSTDGGTGARVFGAMLQWMQEKTKPVFIVATANDVSALPPEFLRKGRFDEQWFVDLPNPVERGDIWKVVAKKLGRPNCFKGGGFADLIAITEGFSGAEIEAVFTEAMFVTYGMAPRPENPPLDVIRGVISRTVPLSKMMSSQISALREWCKDRARPATAPERAIVPTGPAGRKLAS